MKSRPSIALLAVLIITFIPFLGLTEFNTKGEPREAIVAMSMLQQGNYILPESFGTDIPYKPPFLAWLTVIASFITGGVNEWSSRLPSALATIAMAMGVFVMYRRRTAWGEWGAVAVAAVTVTSFEVYRAATACRVDMVLTACIVGALISMFLRHERQKRGLPWAAILLMTCAVLTKGPVGMLLPCLVMGIYRLLRGDRFWPTFGSLTITGLLSLIVPALWYYAAWRQGGDAFLELAIEENFGRFTGRMSYDSHVNPVHYNFITLLAGMLPYTLLCLLSLFTIRLRNLKLKKFRLHGVFLNIRHADPVKVFSVVAAITILIFYSIPKSKRSVYLLPMYPFLAYFVTLLIIWLIRNGHKRIIAIYASVIGTLATLPAIVFTIMRFIDPATAFPSMKASTLESLNAIRDIHTGFIVILLLIMSLACGLFLLYAASHDKSGVRTIFATICTTFTLYWALSGVYFPAVLNPRSDKAFTSEIFKKIPENAHLYSWLSDRLIRFYSVGFYSGDRVRLFENNNAPAGYVLVGKGGIKKFREIYGDKYDFSVVAEKPAKSGDIRDIPVLLHFQVIEK